MTDELIDKTARDFSADKNYPVHAYAGFKAGAEWMREQLMKGLCYETEVYIDGDGDGIETESMYWPALKNDEIYKLPEDMEFNEGDKVQIIIVKKED